MALRAPALAITIGQTNLQPAGVVPGRPDMPESWSMTAAKTGSMDCDDAVEAFQPVAIDGQRGQVINQWRARDPLSLTWLPAIQDSPH